MTEQKIQKLRDEVNKTFAEFVAQSKKTDEYRDKWIRARIKIQDAEQAMKARNEHAS